PPAGRRNGPQVAVAIQVDRPVCDVTSVGRPLRLHGIFFGQQALLSGCGVHGPKLADSPASVLPARNALFGVYDLSAVRRPRRVESLRAHAPHPATVRTHHENTSTIAFGTKRDLPAVR